jgi:hypothetical protein
MVFKKSIASKEKLPQGDEGSVQEDKSSLHPFLRGMFGDGNHPIPGIIHGELVEGQMKAPLGDGEILRPEYGLSMCRTW